MWWLVAVLLIAGCTPAPVKFSEPPKDAPVWDLNSPPDRMQSNDLIHPPTVGRF